MTSKVRTASAKPEGKKTTPAKPKTKKAVSAKPKGKKDYVPTTGEKYMSSQQLAYFKKMLEDMRHEIVSNAEHLIDTMRDETNSIPDENDRATKESEFAVKLREQDRERRLLYKIEAALARVESKEFGNCCECGDPIGLKRLLARPVAMFCFECKNLREKFEKRGGAFVD